MSPGELASLAVKTLSPDQIQALLSLSLYGKAKVQRQYEKAILSLEALKLPNGQSIALCRTAWGEGTHDMRQPPMLATLTLHGLLASQQLGEAGHQKPKPDFLSER